ncbi:YrbL family protein [Providencia huaxiensis]|uniref:YrbL family protein n=1 Tax=Providencia huaxiensis TaxID=2027290 RepID=UPI0032DA2966
MNKNLDKKISLPSTNLIASGRQRACYQHPEHHDLCIKVHLNGRDDKETLREIRYYKRLYRKNFTTKTISHYYGTQQTDQGLGYVFQLIKDKTGNVSHTLDYYLKNKQLFLKHKKNMKVAYEQFKKNIYKEAITTMALKTYNIVYQLGYKPCGQFLIIDNLGSANLIPIDYFSTKIARSTLNRRFTDFEQRLYRDYNIKI